MTYTHRKALLKIFIIMSMSYSHSEEGTVFFVHKEKDTVFPRIIAIPRLIASLK